MMIYPFVSGKKAVIKYLTAFTTLLAASLFFLTAAPSVRADSYDSYDQIDSYFPGEDGEYGTADDRAMITLSFDANGGTFTDKVGSINGYTMTYGDNCCIGTIWINYCYTLGTEFSATVQVPSLPAPTRDDTTFQHWVYHGGSYSGGSSITVHSTSKIPVLTASWEKAIFCMGVDSANGDPDGRFDLYKTYEAGATSVSFTAPAAPSFTGGNTFLGWRLYKDSTVYSPGAAITINPQEYEGDLAYLGGVWNSDSFEINKTFTLVFFNPDGGMITSKDYPFRYTWKYVSFGKAEAISGEKVLIPSNLYTAPAGYTLTWNTHRKGKGKSFSPGGNVYDYIISDFLSGNNGLLYGNMLRLYAQVNPSDAPDSSDSQNGRNTERAITDEKGNVKILRTVIDPLAENQKADVLAAMKRFDKSFDSTSKNILLYDIYLMDDSDVILTEPLKDDIPVFLSYPTAEEGEIYSDYKLFCVKEDGTVEEIETEADDEGLTFALRERGRYVLLWQSAVQEQPEVSATDAVSSGRNVRPLLYGIGGALAAVVLAVGAVVIFKKNKNKAKQPAQEDGASQEAAAAQQETAAIETSETAE